MTAITRILVATDFSPCSHVALTYGRALAGRFGAELHVLHAVEPMLSDANAVISVGLVPEMQKALEDAERGRLEALVSAEDRRALRVTTCLRTLDPPAHAITDYAADHQIDLIVIGTHGRHGLAQMVMGSVAEHVVRTAPCPVLTVRDHEREFVVPDPADAPAARADHSNPAL